jgi:hypothetical protein
MANLRSSGSQHGNISTAQYMQQKRHAGFGSKTAEGSWRGWHSWVSTSAALIFLICTAYNIKFCIHSPSKWLLGLYFASLIRCRGNSFTLTRNVSPSPNGDA